MNRVNEEPASVFFAIAVKDGDVHIGDLKLGPIDWIHRHAVLGMLIGDKSYWGQGYGSEAAGLAAEFAFQRLHLHKLIVFCYSVNVGGIKSPQKAGFSIEGRSAGRYLCVGQYVDSIMLGLINPNTQAKAR